MRGTFHRKFALIIAIYLSLLASCSLMPGAGNSQPEWLLGTWRTELSQDEYRLLEFFENGKVLRTEFSRSPGQTAFHRESSAIYGWEIDKDNRLQTHSYADGQIWYYELAYTASDKTLKLDSGPTDAEKLAQTYTKVTNPSGTQTPALTNEYLAGTWKWTGQGPLAEIVMYFEFSRDGTARFRRENGGQAADSKQLSYSLLPNAQIEFSPDVSGFAVYDIFAAPGDRLILYKYDHSDPNSVLWIVLELTRVP